MKAGTFVSTASAAVLCAIVGSASAGVIYVDPDAIGLPTGTNWFNAYRMVGTALAAASDGDEIWIASGRYEPPMSGWTLNVGASVYGGFTPGATDLDDRDPIGTPTVLDADLGEDDAPGFLNRSDNAERVLTVDAPGGSVRLDGLVIRGCDGWAAVEVAASDGATVASCRFRDNRRTLALAPPEVVRISAYGAGLLIGEAVPAALVVDCVFESNRVENVEIDPANDLGSLGGGAGLASYAATTVIEGSVFRENSALLAGIAFGCGASLLGENTEIRDSVFTENTGLPSGSGGGVYVGSLAFSAETALLERCRFENNAVVGMSTASAGGGARLSVRDASVVSCDFLGNSSSYDAAAAINFGGGGGLSIDSYQTAHITNCRVLGNDAGPSLGGGISLISSYSDDEARIENCLVAGNSSFHAGGVFLGFTIGGRGAGAVTNTTIARNTATTPAGDAFDGGGLVIAIALDAPAAVHNTILWGNSSGGSTDQAAQLGVNEDFPPMLTVRRSLVEGWTGDLGGAGNSGDDPLFADPDGSDGTPGTADDNYRLERFSPAIDAGSNSLVPLDVFDLDSDGDTAEALPIDLAGRPRRVDDIDSDDTGAGSAPIVDIGAYEFQRRSCPGDLNHDGLLDLADITIFVGGFPGQSPESDLNGDGLWDLADINIFVGTFNAGCP